MMQMNLVLDDTIRVPLDATDDLAAFRQWTKSDNYPDRGDYAYLNGDLWVDLSMETLLHNQIKMQIAAVLSLMVVDPGRLGRFFADRMRLVTVEAGLSCEPDAMFASRDSIQSGLVTWEEGAQSLEVIGLPDMVLEVVNTHSVQKDTVVLRDLYAAAGIAEYWLVNPLGGQLSFEILRLTAKSYTPTRQTGGWVKSTVFGKSFRLVEEKAGGDDLPEYRLLVR
jgi:Uma2 family endonuclease